MKGPSRGLAPIDAASAAGASVGVGRGAIITTFFGFAWFGWGLGYAQVFSPLPWIALYACAIALFVFSIRAERRGGALLTKRAPGGSDFWPRVAKRFYLVLLLEFVLCGVAVALVYAYHREDLLAAGISFAVGLHFLPLGSVFRFSAYYVTGSAMVVCAVVSAMLFRAETITLAVGLASGTVLWLTSIYALVRADFFARIAEA